jgi:hypothetical protein
MSTVANKPIVLGRQRRPPRASNQLVHGFLISSLSFGSQSRSSFLHQEKRQQERKKLVCDGGCHEAIVCICFLFSVALSFVLSLLTTITSVGERTSLSSLSCKLKLLSGRLSNTGKDSRWQLCMGMWQSAVSVQRAAAHTHTS